MIKYLLAVILSLSVPCFSLLAQSNDIQDDLTRLDKTIKEAEHYSVIHEQKINSIKEALNNQRLTPEERYNHLGKLYELYSYYNFELASSVLQERMSSAELLRDKKCISEVKLDEAMLLTSAGMFMEANGILENIDTSAFDTSLKLKYWNTMQRFCQDYSEFNPSAEVQESFKAKAGQYRGKIIDNAAEGSFLRRYTIMLDHINNGYYTDARDSGVVMLASLPEDSHDYAIISYYTAVACQELGEDQAALHWFTESAICDFRCSVKDYASLSCIAIAIFDMEEVERAFSYIQISLEDAHFYNSKVRPWQIARFLPAIEKAYIGAREAHSAFAFRTALWLSVLSVLLLAALFFVISLYLKYRKNSTQLSALNEKLADTLGELSEANKVKEEYIGLFLSMCSDYLAKLNKVYTRDQMEKELKSFYNTFDNAFIQIYPDFVEKFNALLKPESRIELKKGEMLNTELRIFALIKLGITQSSHIASLLRYSVNTIYNYRAQIKNAALGNKDNFEDLVRKIN